MLLIATVAGAALGVVVAWIARWVSGRLGAGDFWKSLPELTRQLATQSDTSEFGKVYGQLIRSLAAHLFRNGVQLGASFAPVAATVILAGPGVMSAYNSSAVELVVHHPRALSIETDSGDLSTDAGGRTLTPFPDFSGARIVTTSEGTFPFSNPRLAQVWCGSDWSALGMQLLGFETHPATDATGFLILRPRRGDINPFWPYLSDLEFLFYLAIALASGVTAIVLKRRKR